MTLKLKVVETKHLRLFLTTIDQLHLLVNSVVKSQFTCCLLFSERVSHSGGEGRALRGDPLIIWFFWPLFFHPSFSVKTDGPLSSPPSEKKNEKLQKLETAINICVSLIKQHWKEIVEIPQKCDFLTWSIQNFVRKVKQFARRCDITWLMDLASKLYDLKKLLISFYAICY